MVVNQLAGITEPGIRAEFQQRFSEAETYWQDLATAIPSNSASESYRWLGSTPNLREWIGGRQVKGFRVEKYDVENKLYEATISAAVDDLRRDKVAGLRMRIAELATRAAQHPDMMLETLLNNGGEAGFLAYDGKTFFATDHESGASGAQSNDITFNASDHTAVTTDEMRKSINAAIQKLISFKDDNGVPLRSTPTGLIAVVPPNLLFTTLEATQASVINATTNIMQNNPLTGAIRVISLPGLTSAVRWSLLKTNVPVRPFIMQEEQGVKLDSLAEGSEEEFKNRQHLYGVTRIYALAYGRWEYAVRTEFN